MDKRYIVDEELQVSEPGILFDLAFLERSLFLFGVQVISVYDLQLAIPWIFPGVEGWGIWFWVAHSHMVFCLPWDEDCIQCV